MLVLLYNKLVLDQLKIIDNQLKKFIFEKNFARV